MLAANRELKKIEAALEEAKLHDEFETEKGFEWKFSSPDAPWQNRCSETLIKSVEKGMTSVIRSEKLMFLELLTIFYEVANLVNKQPISIHPENLHEGAYLCPNYLLLVRATSRINSGLLPNNVNEWHRFKFIQMLINSFWRNG